MMEQPYQKRQMHLLQRLLNLGGLTPMGACGIALLAILPLVPPFNREYLIRWLTMGCQLAVSAMAFDFSAGYISILNFGFMAFIGLGAYTSTLVCIHFGLSPWVGIFIGILPAALMGFLTGVISLRLRGIFAVFLTWFFGLALMGVATQWVGLTRGAVGLQSPRLLNTASNLPYFYIILTMLFVTYVVLKWIVRSHMGLAFRAIGQNLDAAKTSGVDPARYRIINFVVSCAFAGWVGGFYAHYYGFLTPDVMSSLKAVELLAIVCIGGRASLWGGALAAVPFVFLMEILRTTFSNLPGINLVIYGAFLIVIMIFYPGGLAQAYESHIRWARSRLVRWLVCTETTP